MKATKQLEDKNERDIRRIMVIGTAIGFGCMTATLEALRSGSSGFTFQITWRTYAAFALGAAALVPIWKIVFNLVTGNHTRSRHIWVALLFLLVGFAAFIYPTRFVPAEKRPDLYVGLAIACCALAICATLLITIGRFLESDKPPGEQQAEQRELSDRQTPHV